MEKKTNLEALIKYNNTDKIDWRKSCENNCIVYFQYGNISDKYYLKEYNRKNKSCIIEYNNKLFSLPTPSILNGRLKNILDIKKDTCIKSKDKISYKKEVKDKTCISAQSIYKNCTHQVKTAGDYIGKYENIDKTKPKNFIMEGY